jgi:hypothetical protein
MAQQMQTRSDRQSTPERWPQALQRALFASVEAQQLAGGGEWIVSSPSRPGIAYRTDGVSCDCEGAMLGGDPDCLHRAAYWYAQGVLELDPEPEPLAPAPPVSCWACSGIRTSAPATWHGATCVAALGTSPSSPRPPRSSGPRRRHVISAAGRSMRRLARMMRS